MKGVDLAALRVARQFCSEFGLPDPLDSPAIDFDRNPADQSLTMMTVVCVGLARFDLGLQKRGPWMVDGQLGVTLLAEEKIPGFTEKSAAFSVGRIFTGPNKGTYRFSPIKSYLRP